jgi:hypothetical protein
VRLDDAKGTLQSCKAKKSSSVRDSDLRQNRISMERMIGTKKVNAHEQHVFMILNVSYTWSRSTGVSQQMESVSTIPIVSL